MTALECPFTKPPSIRGKRRRPDYHHSRTTEEQSLWEEKDTTMVLPSRTSTYRGKGWHRSGSVHPSVNNGSYYYYYWRFLGILTVWTLQYSIPQTNHLVTAFLYHGSQGIRPASFSPRRNFMSYNTPLPPESSSSSSQHRHTPPFFMSLEEAHHSFEAAGAGGSGSSSSSTSGQGFDPKVGNFVENNNNNLEGELTGRNGESFNGFGKPLETESLNGSSPHTVNGQGPKNGVEASSAPPPPPPLSHVTAPEVTHWTEIMREDWTGGESLSITKWESVLSDSDLQQIEQYWQRLLPVVNYLGTEQVAKIYKALCVAYRAHRGQMRKSGDPFIIHPVEVAYLLGNLKMDGETVQAGLLHDTVEDTELTFGQVESLFGYTVRSIVEGETKVSKLPKLAFADYADEQAENLRQMFVAMTDDYRIIIVKLADRLHNMRTLRHMKPEKQIKISRETLDIFAPLAHRMGIWQFKAELEDTAFMYLYPQEYKRLNRKLRQHQQKFRDTLDKSQKILQRQLNNDSTLQMQADNVEVCGRTKEIYSLWHKMETKGERNLDHIVDVVALRVIITPKGHTNGVDEHETDRGVWLCYHVLGLVQHLPGFQPVPTRVKDYISFPKPNGYQSLHTALILNGQTIEVQIRTSMMHQVAEYGMASHWAYTDVKRRQGEGEELYNTPWLSSIKEWQNDRISSRDFVDSVRRELLGKRVFVFLRNGKILNLSRGATVIDAAFQIHTEVGLTMHGVEINGKPVPFSYELQNGDVVSILTGKGKPSTDWMRYAKSRSTRSKLRSYFRTKQRESLREAGKIILLDYLKMHRRLIERNSFLEDGVVVPKTVDEVAELLPGPTHFRDIDDLLIAVGRHHDRSMLHKTISQLFAVPKKLLVTAEEKKHGFVPGSVLAAVQERRRKAEGSEASKSPENKGSSNAKETTVETMDISSMDNIYRGLDAQIEYADPEHVCEDCLPVHGDQIVGTKIPDQDVITTVHRVGCPHAQRALNEAAARQNQLSIMDLIKKNGSSILNGKSKIDSVSLRYGQKVNGRNQSRSSSPKYKSNPIPVPLEWSDLDENNTEFLAEVVVLCQDRKLLLADCSEVVSETAEIVKTGSSSNDDHATLVFLVKVGGLDQLQELMDRLGMIRSVMSVERRFGSELA